MVFFKQECNVHNFLNKCNTNGRLNKKKKTYFHKFRKTELEYCGLPDEREILNAATEAAKYHFVG